jgi:hypothetical protein
MWLYLRLRLYQAKSVIYRALFERGYGAVKIRTFASLDLLPPFLQWGRLWRADGPRQFWDVTMRPERAQQIFAGEELTPTSGLDCEDHAAFLIAAITRSMWAGLLREVAAPPMFLAAFWCEPGNLRVDGHVVCLLKMQAGGWAYMDYKEPSAACVTVGSVAELVFAAMAPAGSARVCWATMEESIKPAEVHWWK